MIIRVTKEEANKHIAASMAEDNYPIEVIMGGNGRYYLMQDVTSFERSVYLKEWKESKGAELPSFPLKESSDD